MSNAVEDWVGEETDEDGPWQAESGEENADGPLDTVNLGDAECSSSNKDNGDLSSNHDAVDTDEEEVALETSKDVELVVETTVVELVEDLHPDESVKDHGVELKLLGWVGSVILEDLGSGKVEDEGDNELEDGLTDDHLPHVDGDEWCLLTSWLAVENLWSWRIGGKGQSSESVHDQVDPQQLDCSKD